MKNNNDIRYSQCCDDFLTQKNPGVVMEKYLKKTELLENNKKMLEIEFLVFCVVSLRW